MKVQYLRSNYSFHGFASASVGSILLFCWSPTVDGSIVSFNIKKAITYSSLCAGICLLPLAEALAMLRVHCAHCTTNAAVCEATMRVIAHLARHTASRRRLAHAGACEGVYVCGCR